MEEEEEDHATFFASLSLREKKLLLRALGDNRLEGERGQGGGGRAMEAAADDMKFVVAADCTVQLPKTTINENKRRRRSQRGRRQRSTARPQRPARSIAVRRMEPPLLHLQLQHQHQPQMGTTPAPITGITHQNDTDVDAAVAAVAAAAKGIPATVEAIDPVVIGDEKASTAEVAVLPDVVDIDTATIDDNTMLNYSIRNEFGGAGGGCVNEGSAGSVLGGGEEVPDPTTEKLFVVGASGSADDGCGGASGCQGRATPSWGITGAVFCSKSDMPCRHKPEQSITLLGACLLQPASYSR